MKVTGTILILMTVFFSGCSQTRQARKVADESGFLGDYSMLQEGEVGESQLIYTNPDADFAAYDKVIVDPVAVWCSKDSKIPQEELANLASYLCYKVLANLMKDYKSVKTPGPGVMRVSVVLTEAKKSSVGLDIFTTIVPQYRLMSEVKSLATGTGAFVGRASVEYRITDSNTGVMLAAMMDSRVGGKTIEGSTEGWNDVEQIFQYWAKELRERLLYLRAGNNTTKINGLPRSGSQEGITTGD